MMTHPVIISMFFKIFCLLIVLKINDVGGKKGLGDYEQDWGHITVRENVNMFWWLFYTTANSSRYYSDRPLIIWLQGGPGMPTSGYGNFLEIGPLDLNLQPREYSWLKNFNLLFIDNPAGVGFTYFSNNATKKYSKSVEEIGRDLVSFIKKFLNLFETFKKVPIYIFGESYGGKMAAEFGYQLHKKIQNKSIDVNFKGLGLGSAFISPADYSKGYGQVLYNLGIIDKRNYNKLEKIYWKIVKAMKKKKYLQAGKLRIDQTTILIEATKGLDVYNLEKKWSDNSIPSLYSYEKQTYNLMNNVVKKSLNLSNDLSWAYINTDVYDALENDIMKPVTDKVEVLLRKSDIKIIVFNGAFDLIVNAVGTTEWLENLNWQGKREWNKKSNELLKVNRTNEGYFKRVGNLVYYTILRAGHSVPIDNPSAMEAIVLKEILGKD